MIKVLEKENDFNTLTSSSTWLVDFYADWCGPCRAFANVAEQIDFIDILKVNVDLFPQIAKSYGIMSIPTLLYFKDGELKEKKIGFQSLEEVKELINNAK